MDIFLSSVISGYEAFRAAAMEGIAMLGHRVVRAEDFPAAPGTPQQMCLAGVRQADAVVLLIGARYGYTQRSGLSATYEEYREARERKPVLVFVEEGAAREPEQEEFLRETQAWSAGHFTAPFTTPEDLKAAVVRALHQHELSSASGPADEAEMLERAQALLPSERGHSNGELILIVVGGPRQPVLRPAGLEQGDLAREIKQQALFGTVPLFDVAKGTTHQVAGHALTLEQDGASVMVDEEGAIRVTLPAREEKPYRTMSIELPAIIEEDITDRLERGLRFVTWLLDRIDPVQRLSDVVVLAAVTGTSYLGWRTRAEHRASPNQMPLGRNVAVAIARLSPTRRKRAVLAHDTKRMADDLIVLLRREARETN